VVGTVAGSGGVRGVGAIRVIAATTTATAIVAEGGASRGDNGAIRVIAATTTATAIVAEGGASRGDNGAIEVFAAVTADLEAGAGGARGVSAIEVFARAANTTQPVCFAGLLC
jgi:hypothetical protein